jgi:hypothetical protein
MLLVSRRARIPLEMEWRYDNEKVAFMKSRVYSVTRVTRVTTEAMDVNVVRRVGDGRFEAGAETRQDDSAGLVAERGGVGEVSRIRLLLKNADDRLLLKRRSLFIRELYGVCVRWLLKAVRFPTPSEDRAGSKSTLG